MEYRQRLARLKKRSHIKRKKTRIQYETDLEKYWRKILGLNAAKMMMPNATMNTRANIGNLDQRIVISFLDSIRMFTFLPNPLNKPKSIPANHRCNRLPGR